MSKKYTKYTEEEWEEIKQYYLNNDISQKTLCEIYNIARSTTDKRMRGLKPNGYPDYLRKHLEVGSKYGHLTIVQEIDPYINNGKPHRMYECQCDCGNTSRVRMNALMSGRIKTCGCELTKRNWFINKDDKREVVYKYDGNTKNNKTYSTYYSMKSRCYNPNAGNYQYYGALGITICDRWLESYENFLEDMGEKPEGMSLDRIDVYGNYEPGNCRWATDKEQIPGS